MTCTVSAHRAPFRTKPATLAPSTAHMKRPHCWGHDLPSGSGGFVYFADGGTTLTDAISMVLFPVRPAVHGADSQGLGRLIVLAESSCWEEGVTETAQPGWVSHQNIPVFSLTSISALGRSAGDFEGGHPL